MREAIATQGRSFQMKHFRKRGKVRKGQRWCKKTIGLKEEPIKKRLEFGIIYDSKSKKQTNKETLTHQKKIKGTDFKKTQQVRILDLGAERGILF